MFRLKPANSQSNIYGGWLLNLTKTGVTNSSNYNVPFIVLTDPSINQQRPPFVVVICPALIGGFVAWVAVCYDGPVHPSMAFLLTGITSVRSVSQRSRGRMLPWVTTLHNPRRKYRPVISLGGDPGLLFSSCPRLKGKHHCRCDFSVVYFS